MCKSFVVVQGNHPWSPNGPVGLFELVADESSRVTSEEVLSDVNVPGGTRPVGGDLEFWGIFSSEVEWRSGGSAPVQILLSFRVNSSIDYSKRKKTRFRLSRSLFSPTRTEEGSLVLPSQTCLL